ncbi:MAG: response regulator [Chloroflexota bacterium]
MPPAHILIVDDEPEIANSLADYLSNTADYVVTKAYDGAEAMEVLQEAPSSTRGPVDLVVLDRFMPGTSGLQVLEWLRQHRSLSYTRVIMFTAASGDQEKVEALSAGADDYVTKPYYPQELLARVETILRTQRLEKQLQRQSEQLATLNRVSNDITTSLEAGQIPPAAVEAVRELLQVEIAAFYWRDKRTGQLHCRAVASASGDISPDDYQAVSGGMGATGRAFTEHVTLCLNDAEQDERFRPGLDAPHGVRVRNLLVTPLMMRGDSPGALSAANTPEGVFSEVDCDLFASLASAVSRAFENATLFQRVRARQQELQESHDRLQAVINGILNPIYTIDEEWRLVAVNQNKADALDTTPDRLVGRLCYRAFFDRETPCEHCCAAETLQRREPRHWSVRWVGDDHLPQEWDVHAYPLPGSHVGAPSAVIVWQDRTEERRLENSLLQAGKLAAIGQLAAGVAHEINNPLTAINANAQMLKMLIPPDDDNYEAVDLIARAGDRATRVVRGLLDFARQNQYSFESGEVNQSILQALRLVSYQLKSADIEVTRRMDEDLPRVRASWEHLKTVWLNLLINARDAVLTRPQGRRIEIETRLASGGDHVQVLFTDNGVGLSEAEVAHIFEPFYTTKEPGQGTGLGLATSQRIIQQHGGDIEVVSQTGRGSTFIVRLPARRSERHRESNL